MSSRRLTSLAVPCKFGSMMEATETLEIKSYAARAGVGYRLALAWASKGSLPPPALFWRDGVGRPFAIVPRGWNASKPAEAVP